MNENRKILQLIETFEDLFEEVVLNHPAQLTHPVKKDASLFSTMEAATTICQPIMQEINATLCLACDHFIGCERGEQGQLVVHCWSHQRKRRLARGTQNIKAVALEAAEQS